MKDRVELSIDPSVTASAERDGAEPDEPTFRNTGLDKD